MPTDYQQYAVALTVLSIVYIIIAPRLHADPNRALGRTQLANDAPALIVADIISSKAPPLPKEIAEDLLNENKNRFVRAAINASRADPVLATALGNAFTEALSKVESNASYKTVLHPRRIMTLWAIVIDDVTHGQVEGEDVWNVKVVQEHVHRLARDPRGRDGKSPIKAVTLRGLFADLFIASRNTPETTVATAVTTSAVPLGRVDKIMYGEEELKMLIEVALKNTERRGRVLAIQNCLFMVLSAITGIRPSSFAPSDKKLKEKKKHPIIQNVKVNLIGPLAFSSRLAINLLKVRAINAVPHKADRRSRDNGGIAARVSFVLEPAKYWYNVIFDPTVWFLCFFIMRDVLDKVKAGAFSTIYPTSLTPLLKTHRFYIRLYTWLREKELLFLKGAQCHFPEEVEVTTSKRLSQAVSKTAQNRGLAWTGLYGFRRAIATLWAKVLNSEHADRLLAHGLDPGSLHNYVDDSSTHDLVAVALLERVLTDEACQIGWTSV
ncbi:hypothetical protein ARMGADRAFT_1141065 [Armillaria gallica]|uniref:Uncharacterized protein n=1 Tax=Armillaria gallica TaxID=47427 RepID=A0A2H3CM99_ARMGA|nr:hypothetical protein ARMGADRAFT_1141065 [Armillaria gallica]